MESTANQKELLSIKKELKRITKLFDGLMYSIETGLLKEDWRLIKRISLSHHKCAKAIENILNKKEAELK